MKIGRNDPCPCGSGKKYKKCHLNIPLSSEDVFEPDEGNQEEVFSAYSKIDKLTLFGALQITPQNHGKNIRLENLIFQALKCTDTSSFPLEYGQVTTIFENHYTFDFMEDPVDNFFTENVIFFGGDYIVYPGITENGTQILNTFLEGIFTGNGDLPNKFKLKVHNASRFLLEISKIIASRCNHIRYCAEDESNYDEEIYVPSEENLGKLKKAIIFTTEELSNIAQTYEIPISAIDDFLLNNIELRDGYDPNSLFLLEKPIYQNGQDYIVVFPTGLITAITSYIKLLATEYNCEKELLNCYYDWQWKKIVEYCYEMSWKLTSITLPPTDLNIIEGVFQFDSDKLAYVCLIKVELTNDNIQDTVDVEIEAEEAEPRPRAKEYSNREVEVLNYLNELNEGTYRYFTLNILGSIGDTFFFSWKKPQPGNQVLTFGFSDFQKIIFAGELDELTLWKFAKAYLVASDTMGFSPLSGMLNSYVLYKENEGSMLPSDDAPPNVMVIGLDLSTDFGRKAIASRDEHAALKWHDRIVVHTPVKRHKKYAPIYSEREKSLRVNLLIESYLCPIWVMNSQAKNLTDLGTINDFIEAIAFWMFKLTPLINDYVNKLGSEPIEVRVLIDNAFLEGTQIFEYNTSVEDDIIIGVSTEKRKISLSIPQDIKHLIILEHNAGERLIMKYVLQGINSLLSNNGCEDISAEGINKIIDTAIPFGPAKMILYVNAAKDPRLRNFNLLSTRYIQDAETSFILDNLVRNMGMLESIPKELHTPKEKVKLCGQVVGALIAQIEDKLKQFDASELLRWLIIYNERYVFNREYREILIPAKIACFSDFPTEVTELNKRERKLVGSSLSVRCLIEFVAAQPHFGDNEVNLDDLDELIALMHEVTQWGTISDTIHFGMSEPKMGLLPSGRIGFSREFTNDFMKPFSEARAENEVHNLVETFENRMRIEPEREPAIYSNEAKELDDAFASEYELTLTQIMHIYRELMNIGILHQESVMIMDEGSLINTLENNLEDLTSDQIRIGLKIISLERREAITKAPPGYEKEDIFPWRYNRQLSFIRRPLVKLIGPDGSIEYYWGFRHVMAAAENLRTLIFIGRIKTTTGSKFDSFIAKINHEKGDEYRNRVFTYLKENTSLRIIDYEVKISTTGHLLADDDYGDIDILAIDDIGKVIYSIECKNTVSARIAHEMKTEMDKYLGRDGASGMIKKHVERDKWLNANKEKVSAFLGTTGKYKIKSLVLTSEEIPLIYLAKEKLPMPILSFKTLKRKGVQVLK